MTDGNARILARSTVKLPQIGLGATVWVDPNVPYIAACLQKRYLVPVDEEPAAEPAVEQLQPSMEPEELERGLELPPPEIGENLELAAPAAETEARAEDD